MQNGSSQRGTSAIHIETKVRKFYALLVLTTTRLIYCNFICKPSESPGIWYPHTQIPGTSLIPCSFSASFLFASDPIWDGFQKQL